MSDVTNIDIAKPVPVYRNLNKTGCLLIAQHGAMKNEIKPTQSANDQER